MNAGNDIYVLSITNVSFMGARLNHKIINISARNGASSCGNHEDEKRSCQMRWLRAAR